jgi:hypothetical protein
MTTRLRRRHLLLTAGMTLLLGACSGASAPAATTGSTGAPTAAAQNPTPGSATAVPTAKPAGGGATGGSASPCSKLTQAEVDTAVGQPLGPGKQVATLDDCVWNATDYAASVDLTIGDWSGIKAAATSGSAVPTAITGVGDEALNLNGSNGSLLYVRKGDAGFLLTINGPHIDGLPDHGLAQEKVLAAAVLGRL